MHVPECKPDLVIVRHVLEHLVDPLGFLQATAFTVAWAGLQARVFIEVPCIDRAIETGCTEDFYDERNSHFTTESFTRMLHRTSNVVEMLLHGYHREIINTYQVDHQRFPIVVDSDRDKVVPLFLVKGSESAPGII